MTTKNTFRITFDVMTTSKDAHKVLQRYTASLPAPGANWSHTPMIVKALIPKAEKPAVAATTRAIGKRPVAKAKTAGGRAAKARAAGAALPDQPFS